MTIRYNQSENTFTPHPDGTYDLEIESAEQTTSKNGNEQLKVLFLILGGERDGKKLTQWYSLTPQSAWKIDALTEATGCPREQVGEDEKGKPIFSFEESELVGLKLTADVYSEEYNGKTNNRMKNERAYTEPAPVGKKAAPKLASVQATKPAPAKVAPKAAAKTPLQEVEELDAGIDDDPEEEEEEAEATPPPASRFKRPASK
jgi:hypothetical protein